MAAISWEKEMKMTEQPKRTPSPAKGSANDHLANERTFLAWIRTSIGLMALGFVIEKFSYFMDEFRVFLGRNDGSSGSELPDRSPIFGIVFVIAGVIIGFVAYLQYKRIGRQIELGNFRPVFGLSNAFMVAVIAVGIFLVVYLFI